MKLNNILFALSTFIIFSLVVFLLKWLSGQLPVNNALWGVYTRSDIALSAAVALVITLSRVRKWRLRG